MIPSSGTTLSLGIEKKKENTETIDDESESWATRDIKSQRMPREENTRIYTFIYIYVLERQLHFQTSLTSL